MAFAALQEKCMPALEALLTKEAFKSGLVQRLFQAIEQPRAEREPLLNESNISFWSLVGIEDDAPDAEKKGYDILSQIPNLCEKGSGIQRNLDRWAQGDSRHSQPCNLQLVIAFRHPIFCAIGLHLSLRCPTIL